MENKKILIVDDSKVDYMHLQKILMTEGYHVSYAESGQGALDMVQDNKPDCILMDVVMPGVNGFQATRQLTKSVDTADIPVLMVSSKAQQTDKLWAERQGAVGYLVKPVKSDELIAKIHSVLVT